MNLTYQAEYRQLLECRREVLDAVRLGVATLPGEFTATHVIDDACGVLGCVDAWDVLNSLNHLVADATIMELTDRYAVWGQHRRYRYLETGGNL